MEHHLKIVASNFKLDFVMLQNFALENPRKYGISNVKGFVTTTTLFTEDLVKSFKLYLRFAPIREYKLIQKYPGSPKKGFIVKRVVKKSDYYIEKCDDDDYTYKAYKGHIERNPKFWKRIK